MLSDNIYKRQQNKITKKCTKWYTIQLWKQKIICLDEPRTFQKNKLHSNTVANINIRCPCRRNVTYMIRPCTAVLIRHEIMEKSVHANALCCWTITPLTLKNSCGNSHTSKITLLHLNPVTWTLLGMIDQLTKITLLNNKSLKIFQLNKYEKKRAENKNTLFLFTDNRDEQLSRTAHVLSSDHYCHYLEFHQPVIPVENICWKEYEST